MIFGRSLALHLLLLKLVADLAYVSYISPAFLYAGFDVDIDHAKYLASLLLTMVLGLLLPARVNRPSDFLLAVIVTFIVLPIICIWSLRDQSTAFLLQVLAGFLLTWMVVCLPRIRLIPLAGGYYIFMGVAVGVSVTYLYFYVSRGGLAFFSFDLGKVYQSREAFENQVLWDWVVYLARWFSKIVVVAGIAVALARRSATLFVLFMAIGLASFFMTTAREQLVYPFIPIGLFVLCKIGRSPSRWMVFSFATVMLVGIATYLVFDSIDLLSFSTLRAFMVIGQNHFLYYEFFNENRVLLFSQNLLSGLVPYPYEKPVPLIIGEGRFGGEGTFSNAGLFASGYMQARFVGILFYSLLTGLVLKLVDSLVTYRMPLHVGLSIGFVAIYQLANIDLLTAMLTQGMAFALLLLYFLSGSGRSLRQGEAVYER